eukprot:2937806-Pyramimonas_sp.AAC.1
MVRTNSVRGKDIFDHLVGPEPSLWLMYLVDIGVTLVLIRACLPTAAPSPACALLTLGIYRLPSCDWFSRW